jgi:hypothetical protein
MLDGPAVGRQGDRSTSGSSTAVGTRTPRKTQEGKPLPARQDDAAGRETPIGTPPDLPGPRRRGLGGHGYRHWRGAPVSMCFSAGRGASGVPGRPDPRRERSVSYSAQATHPQDGRWSAIRPDPPTQHPDMACERVRRDLHTLRGTHEVTSLRVLCQVRGRAARRNRRARPRRRQRPTSAGSASAKPSHVPALLRVRRRRHDLPHHSRSRRAPRAGSRSPPGRAAGGPARPLLVARAASAGAPAGRARGAGEEAPPSTGDRQETVRRSRRASIRTSAAKSRC